VKSETGGYGFHYYRNDSENNTILYETVTHNQTDSIELMYATDPKNPSKVMFVVQPEQENLYIIKILSLPCSTSYTYKSHLKYSRAHLKALAVQKGKSYDIQRDGTNVNMKYHLFSHDFGYVFAFENNHDTLTLDVRTVISKLVNLKFSVRDLQASRRKELWWLQVKPGAKAFRFLSICTLGAQVSLSYINSYKFLSPGEMPYCFEERCGDHNDLSDEQIMTIVKNRGEKTQLKNNGIVTEASFYTMYFDSFFAMYFENNEANLAYIGNFSFKPTNLRIDSADNKINVNLRPYEKNLVKLSKINPEESVSVQYTYFSHFEGLINQREDPDFRVRNIMLRAVVRLRNLNNLA